MMIIPLDSPQVITLSRRDRRLARVITTVGPLDCRDHADAFSFIAGEVIEQMLSIKVADILRGRVRELAGGTLSPQGLIDAGEERLRSAGLSRGKAQCLVNLAHEVLAGRLDLDSMGALSDEEILSRLTALRGIGPWTAKMYLLFVLRREDVLPFEDGAFMQSFRWLYQLKNPSRATVINRCRRWRPYSSTAARYLYRALDLGLTRTDVRLFLKGGGTPPQG